MSSSDIIKCIYETKREQLLLAWKNPATRKFIDEAYVYAYYVRMPPYGHNDYEENDPFECAYQFSADFAQDVLKYVDDLWVADRNKTPTFYDLEGKFGGKSKRIELLSILRYARLQGQFGDDFYKKLLSDAPIEANSISNEKLDESEIYLC